MKKKHFKSYSHCKNKEKKCVTIVQQLVKIHDQN